LSVIKNNSLVVEDNFYPILFGNKNYEDIFGFKGKIITSKTKNQAT